MSTTDRIADRLGELFALQGDRIRDEIRAGLQETSNALRLRGARNRPLYPDALVWGGPGRLVGWSIRATGGAVSVTLHDGRDTAGEVLAVIDVPAGESTQGALPGGGVSITEALYADVSGAGAVQGSIYLGAVD